MFIYLTYIMLLKAAYPGLKLLYIGDGQKSPNYYVHEILGLEKAIKKLTTYKHLQLLNYFCIFTAIYHNN